MTIARRGTFQGNVFTMGDHEHVVLWDDFLGVSYGYDSLSAPWAAEYGTSVSGVDVWAVQTGGVTNGWVSCRPGDSTVGTLEVNGAQLHSKLDWQADDGNLVLECYLEVEQYDDLALFVGFTNSIELEMPIESNLAGGDVLTNTAINACGFLWDFGMETHEWWGVGIDNNGEIQSVCLRAVLNETPARFRVELNNSDAAPTAVFFIDGVYQGEIASGAIDQTVRLTPVVVAFRREGSPMVSNKYVRLDWIYVASNRKA